MSWRCVIQSPGDQDSVEGGCLTGANTEALGIISWIFLAKVIYF